MEIIPLALCQVFKAPPLLICFIWGCFTVISLAGSGNNPYLHQTNAWRQETLSPSQTQMLIALKVALFPIGFFVLPAILPMNLLPPWASAILLLVYLTLTQTKRNGLSFLFFGILGLISLQFCPFVFVNAMIISSILGTLRGEPTFTSDREDECSPWFLLGLVPSIGLIGGLGLSLNLGTMYSMILDFLIEPYFIMQSFNRPNSRVALTTLLSHNTLDPKVVFAYIMAGLICGLVLSKLIKPKFDPNIMLALVFLGCSTFPGAPTVIFISLILGLAIKMLIPARGMSMVYSFPYFS